MSEIDVPGPWRVDTDTEEASQEYNPRAQPLVRLERDSLDLWITIERRDPTEGSPRDIVQYLFTIGLNADGPGTS